jgi:uncharacterized protein (DUF1697 family)
MPTFVALLRGINVGKAKRIAMADLRALLSQLGYTHVATLLNSGNAVFSAPNGTAAQHADAIAHAIASQLHMEVPVIVKSAKELLAIVDENPLAAQAQDQDQDHARLLAVFVQNPKQLPALAAIEPLTVPPERFAIGPNAAYLHCASGILESKAGAALLSKVGDAATTRNWGTVLKLRALVDKTADASSA